MWNNITVKDHKDIVGIRACELMIMIIEK